MQKLNVALAIAATLLAITMVGQVAVAQDIPDSLYLIDRAGVNSSLLTIGMAGANYSMVIINTSIVEISLTGVHIYPIGCDFGLLRPGDIRTTGQAFTIYNASNLTLNVTIAVAGDWAGTHNWTHSDDCTPGVDIAGLVAIVDGGGGHTAVVVKKSEPYNYLVSDMAPGQEYSFGLQIYAPTSFSDYSQKQNRIFIVTESEP